MDSWLKFKACDESQKQKQKWGKKVKERKKGEKNRNGRDYLEAQRNKEPLRDHEGNIEWKDPFKSGN